MIAQTEEDYIRFSAGRRSPRRQATGDGYVELSSPPYRTAAIDVPESRDQRKTA